MTAFSSTFGIPKCPPRCSRSSGTQRAVHAHHAHRLVATRQHGHAIDVLPRKKCSHMSVMLADALPFAFTRCFHPAARYWPSIMLRAPGSYRAKSRARYVFTVMLFSPATTLRVASSLPFRKRVGSRQHAAVEGERSLRAIAGQHIGKIGPGWRRSRRRRRRRIRRALRA